jgi:hypothetical protein
MMCSLRLVLVLPGVGWTGPSTQSVRRPGRCTLQDVGVSAYVPYMAHRKRHQLRRRSR